MKLRARSTVFWPGITKDIERTVSTCTQCQESSPKQERQPMIPSEVPPRVWHTLGADLFTMDGEYLVVADYYSKYPFVYKMASTDSYAIINKLKPLFAEQGIPAILRSDNGPQFASYKFRQFAKLLGFRHETSSPYYPQGNGFIESQVKIVKQALSKAQKNGQDLEMALLCLRATPIDRDSKSPAELLFGRKIQDNLPRRFARTPEEDHYYQHLNEKQEKQKEHYDQHAKPLQMVVSGQPIYARNPQTSKWEPGTVTDVSPHRSVHVDLEKGTRTRRNRVDVREAWSPVNVQESPPESPISTDPIRRSPERHSPISADPKDSNSQGTEPAMRTALRADSRYRTRSLRPVKARENRKGGDGTSTHRTFAKSTESTHLRERR